jgi:hypothetical protein
MGQDPRRSRLLHLVIAGLYAALALVLTWPLARYLSSHVPGSYTWAFDEYTFLWNTWWFRYSLLDLGQNPLYSTHTFYPLGISLVLHTYNLFNALISLPLQPFLSLAAINNLTFWFATVLSAYGTFLLVCDLLRHTEQAPDKGPAAGGLVTGAAFLAGLIYAFGSYRMVYAAMGHADMWSTAWIPFFALYLARTLRESRLRNPALAGLFLVLSMLCEMIFGVFLAMLALVILAFALGRRQRATLAGGASGLLGRLVVLALVALVGYAPILVPVLREMLAGYELAGWGDAEKLSVDLMGLVTPTALHPLGGDWSTTLRQVLEGTARFRDVNTVFLGWAGLTLAVVGALRYRRQLAAWITSAVLFAVFSFGPLLQINGRSTFDLDGLQTTVPLPFILLHYLPVIKANRVPNRFSVVLMLALAVLAAFGAYWLLSKLRRRASRAAFWPLLVALPLAGLILFEHWSVPLPLTDARIPAAYAQVVAEPEDFAILQLPLGWRNSFGMQGAEDTQTQYYQSFHHKRLLSGNISRNPPFKFDYFRQNPILDSLITLQTYGEVDAERRTADRERAGPFVAFYDIRYVVVAPGVPGRPPYVDTREAAIAYVEEVLPVQKAYEGEGWLLYRVEQPPAKTLLQVDLGSPDLTATMALGEGWGQPESIQGIPAHWAVAQGAQILLSSTTRAEHRLTLAALPFDYPGAEEQRLTVRVNGRRLEEVRLLPGWQTYAWQVPAEVVRRGINDLRLEFGRLDAPADVLPGNGTIGSTGLQAPVAIEVNSGGAAGFAYITVGEGPEALDASAHHPGYNVALLHPRSGKVLDSRGFDTTPGGNGAQAAALAEWIAAVPRGHIVVVALQGDGIALLSQEAVDAFHSLGAALDPRGDGGGSHAIVGVQGAPPGSALEAAGPEGSWLRVAPDRRRLGVALDAVIWEQTGP